MKKIVLCICCLVCCSVLFTRFFLNQRSLGDSLGAVETTFEYVENVVIVARDVFNTANTFVTSTLENIGTAIVNIHNWISNIFNPIVAWFVKLGEWFAEAQENVLEFFGLESMRDNLGWLPSVDDIPEIDLDDVTDLAPEIIPPIIIT